MTTQQTFPATKRLWGFLWRVPVGWTDSGEVAPLYYIEKNGETIRVAAREDGVEIQVARQRTVGSIGGKILAVQPALNQRLNNFLLAIAVYLGTPETAIATTTAPVIEAPAPLTFEDKTRAAFPEAPETMVAIARCESHLPGQIHASQFEADGVTPRYGRMSSDIGGFQINAIHWPDAAAKGIDLKTEDGNIAYARFLYDTQGGTDPWYMSGDCW